MSYLNQARGFMRTGPWTGLRPTAITMPACGKALETMRRTHPDCNALWVVPAEHADTVSRLSGFVAASTVTAIAAGLMGTLHGYPVLTDAVHLPAERFIRYFALMHAPFEPPVPHGHRAVEKVHDGVMRGEPATRERVQTLLSALANTHGYALEWTANRAKLVRYN